MRRMMTRKLGYASGRLTKGLVWRTRIDVHEFAGTARRLCARWPAYVDIVVLPSVFRDSWVWNFVSGWRSRAELPAGGAPHDRFTP